MASAARRATPPLPLRAVAGVHSPVLDVMRGGGLVMLWAASSLTRPAGGSQAAHADSRVQQSAAALHGHKDWAVGDLTAGLPTGLQPVVRVECLLTCGRGLGLGNRLPSRLQPPTDLAAPLPLQSDAGTPA